MEYTQFKESLKQENPEKEWPEFKKALWWTVKGNWEKAHDLAQDMDTTTGSWIHAYLHRLEGDRFNAGYWYRMAKRPYPKLSLEEELEAMILELLQPKT